MLIEKDPTRYDKLFRLFSSLTASERVQVIPIPGLAQDHMARVVDTAVNEPVLIFTDPCGCEIPEGLDALARNPHVTLLLRFSDTAARRSKQTAAIRKQLKKIAMPYWRFNGGDARGPHKFKMLLGTHSMDIAEACGNCLSPIKDPREI